MTTQQLFDSFALEGKISTEHAREIKEILDNHLSLILSDIEKQIAEGKWNENHSGSLSEFQENEIYNQAKQDDLNIISQFKDGLK